MSTPRPATIDTEQALEQLTSSVGRWLDEAPDSVMIGIHTGGVWVAERLHTKLQPCTPLGKLNISFYRDDFSQIGLHPHVGPSQIDAAIDGQNVILIDDVLYTGRTIRAALNELFDYGRPAAVQLGVLIDRGGRELPFAPDGAGAKIDLDTSKHIKLTGPEPLALDIQ